MLLMLHQISAQEAFIGYNYETTNYPLAWTTSATTFNGGTSKEVVISSSGGSIKTAQICSPSNNNISHYELGGTAHLIEIQIPDHATSEFLIQLTGSSNSSTPNACKAGVVYSDKIPFDPNSCLSAEETAFFPAVNGNWTKININPPAGAKSLRIYRRVFFGNGTMSTSSGSGRVQFGLNQTIRLASVAAWATALPTIQARNLSLTSASTTSLNMSWLRGSGSSVAVFVKEGVGPISNPLNQISYNASNNWDVKASQLGSSGYYCIYNGTGTSVTLTGLSPNTSYSIQAFEYSGAFDFTKYLTSTAVNNPVSLSTLPLTIATITAKANNIFSTKFNGNATISYNGGTVVTEKGFVWGTSPNPTTSNNLGKIISGSGDESFNSLITSLNPSTTYFVRAYAINAVGVAYSNELQVTTSVIAPLLISSQTSISFGELYYQSPSAAITYNLSSGGANLTPATGNITVTAPTGFQVSLNATTGFASSINVPYSNGVLASTPIYVKLPTNLYGIFSGEIIHATSSVVAGEADKVVLTGSVIQEEISNSGTDFWLGFGYMSDMNNNGSPANLSVYVAAGAQDATVTVSIPGLNHPDFPKVVNIPANTVVEVSGFPTADNARNLANLPDSRLFATGVFDRGINVNSNGVPVSVWMYTWTRNNSAAGAMVFPTSTWSSSYTVQAYGESTNSGIPNSFFFVVANEDNTEIEFSPSNPILKGTTTEMFTTGHTSANVLYEPNPATPYKVTLNKGQIFNAMGMISSGFGLDLSGTTVRTNCDKKIAVFAGNGRSRATSELCASPNVGSDNMIQQMFPNVAWGTKYLTSPTKSMEYNVFRVYVQDASTVVSVDGVILAKTAPKWNASALYYTVESNKPLRIEGNKPINVTQLILSESCGIAGGYENVGNNGTGDPEMIILSPIQQAVNRTTVYSPNFKNNTPGASYINVIIRREGVASFLLNNTSLALDTGSNSFDATQQFLSSNPVNAIEAFKPHPRDANYYYAKFKVETGKTHTLSSAHPFNAIAYGMSKGESYGFNAGTTIKNLSSIKLAVNTSATDTSSTTVKVAKGTPVKLQIALPHPPATVTNIQWVVPSSNPTITPAGSSNGVLENGVAKFDGTIQVDGRTFYVYSSPVNYTFSEAGSHFITAIATGSFAGDCAGSDEQRINVLVGLDNIDIAYQTNCGNPLITFTNNTTPMEGTTITKWLWNFGDNTTSDLQNPPVHTYNKAAGTVYTVRLTTTNSAGIVSTKTMQVDFSGEVTARFTTNAISNRVCAGGGVEFNASSSSITSSVSGVPVKWTWSFGDGSPLVIVNGSNSPIQNHVYSTIGNYTVSLLMETSTGCSSTYTQDINVYQLVPAVISATSTINSIEFSWDAIPSATRYEVSIDNGATYFTPSSGASGTNHLITGLQPDQTIKLIVRASGLSACESLSDELTAKTDLPNLELFVPNTFTPNGDGLNDELKVYGNYMQSINMRVFNQWGEQIFFTTELNRGWDGTYKGNQQPVGVYIYVITVVMQDGTKINKKGSINLIR